MIGAAVHSAARPLTIGLWTAAVLAIGIAVAVPEQTQDTLFGVAAAGALLASLIHPIVGLLLLLVAVPFGSRGGATTEAATDPSIGAAELAVALVAAAWLAYGVRRRAITLPPVAIVVTALGMAALAGLSVGYAEDKGAAIKETLKWLELALALLIVVDLVRTPRAARWVIAAMLVAGAGEATYGAFQFLTESGPSTFQLQGALRAFGHFDQPNPFAGYLTTILPLAACMALSRANPPTYRWLAGIAMGFMALGIGLSQSRGAWLGAAVAATSLLLLWSHSTRRLLIPCGMGAVLLLAMAVSGALPAAILDRLAQAVEYFGVFDVRTVEVSSENWAVVERMAHWQAGWNMFEAHPWLGVGAGNYAQAYPLYFVGMWREALGHAHNYYLNMLAELGVIGGGALVLFLSLAFAKFGRTLVHSEQSGGAFWRAVLAGVVGGLVVFCVHNLFDSLFVHSVNVQIGVLLGLGIVAAEHLRERVV